MNDPTSTIIVNPLSKFPVEIWECVFDNLGDSTDDHVTHLKQCSLVCAAWRSLCRPRIWTKIEIINDDTHDGSKSPSSIHGRRFTRIILENKEIGKYIRDLTYWIPPQSVHQEHSVPSEEAFQCLTDLRSFVLTNLSRVAQQRRDWDTISSEQAILHVLNLPTLTSLEITISRFTNLPLLSLFDNRALKSVTIYVSNCRFRGGTILPSSEPSKPEELVLIDDANNSQDVCQVLLEGQRDNDLPVMDFTNLKRASFLIKDEKYITLFTSLLKRTLCVEQLRLQFGGGMSSAFVGVHQVTRPTIRTLYDLTLFRELGTLDTLGTLLAGLCPELEQIRGNNQLKTLTVSISLDDTLRVPNEDICGDWKRLDEILTSAGWPVLSKVTVIMHRTWSWIHGPPLAMKLKNIPSLHLPRLCASKELSFEYQYLEKGQLDFSVSNQ